MITYLSQLAYEMKFNKLVSEILCLDTIWNALFIGQLCYFLVMILVRLEFGVYKEFCLYICKVNGSPK